MAAKKARSVEDFTVAIIDNAHVEVTLGDEKVLTDRGGVLRLIKALSAVATEAR